MKDFARLFAELDASTATQAKVDALNRYFGRADHRDAAWAVYFLAGGKPRQTVPTRLLRETACAAAGLNDWLFEECYQAVGDLAETIAHVLPPPEGEDDTPLADWIEQRLLPLRGAEPADAAALLREFWRVLDTERRFLLTKLIGGGFRVGVSKLLVTRALAEFSGVDAKRIAQRLMGATDKTHIPSAASFAALIAADAGSGTGPSDSGTPYPFFLAHALNEPAERFAELIGPPDDWQVEWKYDGIRAQLVKRAGQVWLWSRGEELITERFPEIVQQAAALPDGTVIDGEVLVMKPDAAGMLVPAPFQLLQQRIGRKTLTRKVLQDAPVQLLAYDLLERDGQDLREQPQSERRAHLEAMAAAYGLALSPLVQAASWADFAALREQSRARGVEGFMLKHRASRYGTGRTKSEGTWWKWKIEPMSIDCVLIYAQAGHGRRASVYTDYTFAVWTRAPRDADEAQAVCEAIAAKQPAGELALVPFAKAYSGLTDEEFRQVDALIRKHTIEKFGPVRSVRPSLVFELGFEGINASPRHKSGIAVRFPRMLRIRWDKPLHEANTLADLQDLLQEAH
ncbi:ATP-dependent DNA ligase [beta proteobacterium AAP99]|nr:ATP-dependent DNA ligase [beta proteobacterium AAP99]